MKRLLIPAAIAVALCPGTASANTPDPPRYDCAGVTFVMPRTEDGTTIAVSANGIERRSVRNDTFGARVTLVVPSPDQSVRQSWQIVVAGYNGTQTYSGTVAPCTSLTTVTAPPTTVTPTTTQVTVPPSSTTSTTPPPSTVPTTTTVAVGPPPTPATVVVTPPRTPAPTTSVPPTFTLPETGAETDVAFVLGVACLLLGVSLLLVRRRGGGL